MAPAVLWIPYCAAIVAVALSPRSTHALRFGRIGTQAVVLLLMVMMFVNHLLPVY
jgi:hypothetical protein